MGRRARKIRKAAALAVVCGLAVAPGFVERSGPGAGREHIRLDRTKPVAAASSPIASRFPAEWRATQGADPASMRWALLVGITDYAGSQRDTIGGRRDARQLEAHLLSLGWREDHILVLADANATRRMILAGIDWLADKTTNRSVAIFSYAGHEMPFATSADGDDESRDVALHAHDNRFVLDGDLGRALGDVRAARMWIHLATCRAGGFDDPGIVKPNRVVTYASPESELSYEDPEVNLSVIGRFMVGEGMRGGKADGPDEGRAVSVEEAFGYGKPRVHRRTSDRQHPRLVDRLEGAFSLTIPPAAPAGPASPPDTPQPPSPRPSPHRACAAGVCL